VGYFVRSLGREDLDLNYSGIISYKNLKRLPDGDQKHMFELYMGLDLTEEEVASELGIEVIEYQYLCAKLGVVSGKELDNNTNRYKTISITQKSGEVSELVKINDISGMAKVNSRDNYIKPAYVNSDGVMAYKALVLLPLEQQHKLMGKWRNSSLSGEDIRQGLGVSFSMYSAYIKQLGFERRKPKNIVSQASSVKSNGTSRSSTILSLEEEDKAWVSNLIEDIKPGLEIYYQDNLPSFYKDIRKYGMFVKALIVCYDPLLVEASLQIADSMQAEVIRRGFNGGVFFSVVFSR
jgi:hypothetical protein